jgi:hypothetical protein
MSAVVSVGEKIHVIHRLLFEGDTRRHFVVTVDARDGPLARVTGIFSLCKCLAMNSPSMIQCCEPASSLLTRDCCS